MMWIRRRNMKRKLFCQLCPAAYEISLWKGRTKRHIEDILSGEHFAKEKSKEVLPVIICSHKSLIRRRLGEVDMRLQENKAQNLAVAAPKVSGILIRPGETFSFWRLVGQCTEKRGYKEGLTIKNGVPSKGIGGGMCQFTNLIHWLVLHTPLEITEHHHHDGIDLFPDFGRQVPFGVGTSVMYNYLDYRFKNNSDMTYQLIVGTDEKYLTGEIRAERHIDVKYHIKSENEYFSKEGGEIFRNGQIFRECVDVRTGNLVSRELIKVNHAKVMYDTEGLKIQNQ